MKNAIYIAIVSLVFCSACGQVPFDTGCSDGEDLTLTNATWNDPEQGLELVIDNGRVVLGDGNTNVDFTVVGVPGASLQTFCFDERPANYGLRTITERSGSGDFRVEIAPQGDVVVERPVINKAVVTRVGEPDQEVTLETNLFEGTAAIIMRSPADERPFSLMIEAQLSLQNSGETLTEAVTFSVEALRASERGRGWRLVTPARCL